MAAAAIGIIGALGQAYGTYQQAEQQAETMEYNALIAEKDAELVEKSKKLELHKAKTTQRKLLARQIAIMGATGRAFSGSPLDVIARSESEAMLDQFTIIENAEIAKGRLYGQAAIGRAGARGTRHIGRGSAVGTFGTTAASMALSQADKKKTKGKTT